MQIPGRRRTAASLAAIAGVALTAILIAGSVGATVGQAKIAGATKTTPSRMLFDDFNYPSAELAAHGWYVRSRKGGPGALDAGWSPAAVSIVADPARGANRLLRLEAATDGTVAGTIQAEVGRSERSFREGTYAARIRFSDAPLQGPRGDRVVQTFFAIGPPLARPLDPAYSELDFEYLPNGGWGATASTMFMTSWDTYQEDPVVEKMTHTFRAGSLAGWHTLVIQVGGGEVRYFIDGHQEARHGGRYYPDSLMSIVFNLWFQTGGLLPAGAPRRYQEDVDWVFQQPDAVLSPGQVLKRVAQLQS
jgi:hypothetical protein